MEKEKDNEVVEKAEKEKEAEEEAEKKKEVVEEAEKGKEAVEEAEKEKQAVEEAASNESRSSGWLNDEMKVSNSTQVEGGPKGFGLKRWRRLKRDSSKDNDKDKDKDGDNPIRLLKRSSSPNNFIDPTRPANAYADADASVSSTNAFAPIFIHGPADSDNSDDRSSKSSTAASAPKSKHRPKSLRSIKPNILPPFHSDSSIKHQPHAPSLHYDNPFSSVDSHPTSNPTLHSHVEPSFTQHSQTHFTTNSAAHHSPNPNCGNNLQPSADPLVHSIHLLRSAQIALDREVERFKELGKEIRLLCDDSNEKDRPLDGWASEMNHLYSNKNVGTLETRLSEAEGRLKEREMKIGELEEAMKNMIPKESKRWQDMEAELDNILKGKIEADIEHLLITRCSKELSVLVEDQIKVMREQKAMAEEEIKSLTTLTSGNAEQLDTIPIHEGKEGDLIIMSIRTKALSSAKCFAIQLSLLLLVLALFISRLTPKSAVVVPT